MRCLSCHYDLRNISREIHRCPECSRTFDPNDDTTFEHQNSFRFPNRSAMITITTTYLASVLLAFLLMRSGVIASAGPTIGDQLSGAAILGAGYSLVLGPLVMCVYMGVSTWVSVRRNEE